MHFKLTYYEYLILYYSILIQKDKKKRAFEVKNAKVKNGKPAQTAAEAAGQQFTKKVWYYFYFQQDILDLCNYYFSDVS